MKDIVKVLKRLEILEHKLDISFKLLLVTSVISLVTFAGILFIILEVFK